VQRSCVRWALTWVRDGIFPNLSRRRTLRLCAGYDFERLNRAEPECALPSLSTEPIRLDRQRYGCYSRRALDSTGRDKHVADESFDFDTIYKEYMPRVLAAIRGVLGHSDELEDVVQMAFMEVFRSLDKFEGRSKLSTWIHRIAVNVAYQHIRQRQRDRRIVLKTEGEESLFERLTSRDELRLIRDRETIKHVFDVMGQISHKKRVVWILSDLFGLSRQEISEFLDIPVNTVRSRLKAARRELLAISHSFS
jgi:RNA polymerase sigma-70 factor (ECF subfamily)